MILKSSRTDKNQGCRQLSKLRTPSEFGGWSGERGVLCWWAAPSRGKPASQSHPARQKAVPFLGWLCLRHSVKPRDSLSLTHTQTHTHKPDPASTENIPALWVLCQEPWLAEQKSLRGKSACSPRASSLLPDVASLVWLFWNPCTALIWGSWKDRDIWSSETGLAPFFSCLFLLCCVLWLSPGQN